jgi:hypothetical protein
VTVDALLARLDAVRARGTGRWTARCPAHDDRTPSLSVAEGDRGLLLRCHAGCTLDAITAALGVTTRDLFYAPARARRGKRAGVSMGQTEIRMTTYDIRDAAGRLVAVHERHDGPGGKRFAWRRSDGQPGLGGLRAADLPLYGADIEWTDPDLRILVEGEKAAEALWWAGIPALATVTGASGTPGPAALEVVRGRDVLLWPDADEVGRDHMRRIADRLQGVARSVRTITWADAPAAGDGADWVERLRARGATQHDITAAWHSLAAAATAAAAAANGARLDARAGEAAEIARLAELSALEYDRIRDAAAKRLGIRVGTLDTEVARLRPSAPAEPGQGRALRLHEIEPAAQSVEGAVLLLHLTDVVRRHVVLPDHAAIAVALWVVWTHTYDFWDTAPRLVLTSPEKRCGKTTLLRVLTALVPRPLAASNVTPAALFRAVEAARPTLLIDEADSFATDNDELRGLVNSGHTRETAYVVRCVGDDHEPRVYTTWTPIALAAIGRLPGTIMDRAIVISLRRRLPDEPICRYDAGARAACEALARSAARWVLDAASGLAAADPAIPDALHDRAADNWRPLLAIAETAGGVWPDRARSAAVALSGEGDLEDAGLGVRLLADIRTIYDEVGTDRLSSAALCERLSEIEEAPWADWRHGKPITPAQLARLLRPFGVVSRTVRLRDGGIAKGYLRDDLVDAWDRYVPPSSVAPPAQNRYSVTSRANTDDEPLSRSVTSPGRNVSQNARIPAPDAACNAVTFPEGGDGRERGFPGSEEGIPVEEIDLC